MIERFGLIDEALAPRIHLGAFSPRMISTCLTASDPAGNAAEQTREILETIDIHLKDHGSGRDRLMMVQVWLAGMGDFPAFREVWNAWVPQGDPPALSVVGAAASTRDTLVEIRAYAAR